MMVFYKILLFLTIIIVPIKAVIGIGFLKNRVACVLFVADHPTYSCCRPATAFFSRYFSAVQLISNFVGALAG